jgi:hypothetical protein
MINKPFLNAKQDDAEKTCIGKDRWKIVWRWIPMHTHITGKYSC